MGQLKRKQTEIHPFYTTNILFRLLQQSMKGHVIYTCVPVVDAQLLVEGKGGGVRHNQVLGRIRKIRN